MAKPSRTLWPIAFSALALFSVWQVADRQQLRVQLGAARAAVAQPPGDTPVPQQAVIKPLVRPPSGELADDSIGTSRVQASPATSPEPALDASADPEAVGLLVLPREQLEALREDLEKLRQEQFKLQFLRSEAATGDSRRARDLLEAAGYPAELVDRVDLEVRLSLRGATATDDDLLWLGGRMLSGDWPVADDAGHGNLELSLAQRLGPARLASSLELPALMSVLERSSDRALSRVWSEASLRAAYERLPYSRRALLRHQFPIAFGFVDETD